MNETQTRDHCATCSLSQGEPVDVRVYLINQQVLLLPSRRSVKQLQSARLISLRRWPKNPTLQFTKLNATNLMGLVESLQWRKKAQVSPADVSIHNAKRQNIMDLTRLLHNTAYYNCSANIIYRLLFCRKCRPLRSVAYKI